MGKNQTHSLLLCCFLLLCQVASGTTYYITTTGNDANTGLSHDAAFLTLYKAVTTAKNAGDEILVAPGTYIMYPDTTKMNLIAITASYITIRGLGTTAATRPIFDFSQKKAANSSYYGIQLKGSYCSLYGFAIKGAQDNGLLINGGSYNTIEFCDFLENQDSGVQIKGKGQYNKFINCDSYYNVDPAQGNADGFADKLDEGGFNSFRGCRAYQNSDDGWDGLLGNVNYTPSDTIYDSWCYKNGYLKDGSKSSGNGNGFKLGGTQGGASGPFIHRQLLVRCLSVKNLQKGFDYNNNAGSMTLYNCTGMGNGGTGNFAFPTAVASGETVTLKNCLSYNSSYGSLYKDVVQATNSWSGGFSVSNADFQSIDDTQLLWPRNDDGSLPVITFLHLMTGSDLIDAGTVIAGLPYNGTKPDLGCFEYASSLGIEDLPSQTSGTFVYPSPSSGRFYISSSLPDIEMYRVYSAAGDLLFEKQAAHPRQEASIDLSTYGNGTYLLEIVGASAVEHHKIILSK